MQAAKKAKDDVKKMVAAAEQRDPAALASCAQELLSDADPIIEALEAQAKISHDAERAQQLRAVAENIKTFTPKAIATGAQSLKVIADGVATE